MANNIFYTNEAIINTLTATGSFAGDGSGLTGTSSPTASYILASNIDGNVSSASFALTAAACEGTSAFASVAAECEGTAAFASIAAECEGTAAFATNASACEGTAAFASIAAECEGTAAMALACEGTAAFADVAAECEGTAAFATNAETATYGSGLTGDLVGTDDSQTLTNKTIIGPIISDWNEAQHYHTSATDGGVLRHLQLEPEYFELAKTYDALTDTYADVEGAISSGGTPFDICQSTGSYLYVGFSGKSFNQLYLQLSKFAANVNLKVEKYTDPGGWADASPNQEGTSNLTSNGLIWWNFTGDEASVVVDSVAAYWVRVSTTSTPSVVSQLNIAAPYEYGLAIPNTPSSTYGDYSISARPGEPAQLLGTASCAISASWAPSSELPVYKAGVLASSSFGDSPLTASVSFVGSFANANYAISVVGGDNRVFSVQNVAAGGFEINSNSATALTADVRWIAIDSGESV